jgi:hypothetical protein
LCVLRFLETEPDQETAQIAIERLCSRLPEVRLFQSEPVEGYGLTPLDFAPDPNSPRRAWFSDASVDAHLDALAAAQRPDGGWPITWSAVTAGAELDWRGVRTLNALRVLTASGRV